MGMGESKFISLAYQAFKLINNMMTLLQFAKNIFASISHLILPGNLQHLINPSVTPYHILCASAAQSCLPFPMFALVFLLLLCIIIFSNLEWMSFCREGVVSQRKIKLLFPELVKQIQHRLKLTDAYLPFILNVTVISILYKTFLKWKTQAIFPRPHTSQGHCQEMSQH